MPVLDLDQIVMIGDKILIEPKGEQTRTESGLYLPPGIKEKEQVQQGYILKTGPGYAIPRAEPDEDWKPAKEKVDFIPLQVEEGDLAVFLRSAAHEIRIHKKKYFIVPHQAVLMVFKDPFIDEIVKNLDE
jgi:co-chaperonin GroES (HSP10)